MLLHPPPGWLALQEMARRATNSHELVSVIEEMNKLLDEDEGVPRKYSVGASDSTPAVRTAMKP